MMLICKLFATPAPEFSRARLREKNNVEIEKIMGEILAFPYKMFEPKKLIPKNIGK
jgi:hypothetical protein